MSCNGMAFFPVNFMLQTSSHEEDHHQPPTSINHQVLPSCTPPDFHGASFLGKRSSLSFPGIDLGDQEANNNGELDDLSDDGTQMAGLEKKRRLNMEQVKTLEKNFELGNKLEPERKIQLARALGLQPRQIAIWFQNRRARWKTKQLEKDYDLLKKQYDAIKADNTALQAHNQKLQAEIMALKSREPTESINLNIKETEGCSSNRSENSSDVKLDISRTRAIDSPFSTHHHQITSRNLFPTSTIRQPTGGGGGGVAQLFQSESSRSSADHHLQIQCGPQKMDHHQMVKEESLSNMFCPIEDQTGFWPWLEQQLFN